jgi:putative redox protein
MPQRIVRVRGGRKFTRVVGIGPHKLISDEPEPFGSDTGPTPIEFLLAALATCTSMTVQMYAERKGWELTEIGVSTQMDYRSGPRGQIIKEVQVAGNLDTEQINRLVAVADRCPVQRMLSESVVVQTRTVVRPTDLPTAA